MILDGNAVQQITKRLPSNAEIFIFRLPLLYSVKFPFDGQQESLSLSESVLESVSESGIL